MAVLSKGTDFSDGDQVTSSTLDALVDSATFVAGASGTTDDSTLEVNGSGRLQVKSLGVGTSQLAASAVTTIKIADGNVTVGKLSTGAPTWDSSGNVTTSGNATVSKSDAEPVVLSENTQTTGSAIFPRVRADAYTGATTSHGLLEMRRARGTKASPTAIQSGDVLGEVLWYGHNGSSLEQAGRITVTATETFSGSAEGTAMSFFVTTTGSTSSVAVMNITDGAVAIGQLNTPADASAILELSSTTRGFLPPRLTTAQRDAVASPAEGLVVYNSTTKKLNFYNGTSWAAVTSV